MTPKRTRRPRKTESASAYQLKITLLESNPPIWRRVQVQADITLGDLNFVLQAAMGWTNSHLHEFKFGDTDYSDPRFELDHAEDEFAVTLSEVAPRTGSRFSFLYDFGDGWDHEIVVEEILPHEPRKRYPVCRDGERACPPEDCGGVWGYEEFLNAIRDPNHEEHEDMLEWIGGEFDPDAFDAKELNRRLVRDAKMFASWH